MWLIGILPPNEVGGLIDICTTYVPLQRRTNVVDLYFTSEGSGPHSLQ